MTIEVVPTAGGLTKKEVEELIAANRGFPKTQGSAGVKTATKIKSAENTLVKMDTAIADPEKHFDLVNGWYVVPETGTYAVTAVASWTTQEGTYSLTTAIFVNGGEVVPGLALEVKYPAGVQKQSVSNVALSVKAGDKIELFVVQNSGKELALFNPLGAPQYNQLDVIRVA